MSKRLNQTIHGIEEAEPKTKHELPWKGCLASKGSQRTYWETLTSSLFNEITADNFPNTEKDWHLKHSGI